MTATNETQEPRFTDPPKKPTKPKTEKRTRQNYLARYTDLAGKVGMALKLLKKATSAEGAASGPLTEMAIELLEE